VTPYGWSYQQQRARVWASLAQQGVTGVSCSECRRLVDVTAENSGTGLMARSLDHIVPVIDGGSHVPL